MKLILTILLPLGLFAQANLKKPPCPGDASKPRLVLFAPASIAGGALVSVPVCVDLGSDLRIVPGAPGENLKLEVAQRPVPIPAWRVESIKIPADHSSATLIHTLAAAPVPGSPVMMFGRFLRAPSVSTAIAADGRSVTITLPDGPFSSDPQEDTITLVYQAQP